MSSSLSNEAATLEGAAGILLCHRYHSPFVWLILEWILAPLPRLIYWMVEVTVLTLFLTLLSRWYILFRFNDYHSWADGWHICSPKQDFLTHYYLLLNTFLKNLTKPQLNSRFAILHSAFSLSTSSFVHTMNTATIHMIAKFRHCSHISHFPFLPII